MPRVTVIGAGIIGAAVAFRLAEKGADVVLLDCAEPGSGATAASYAWVNANDKLPRAYFALSVAAMQEYRRLAWRLAPAPWYHADGNLIWYAAAADYAALQERVERLRGWGYAAEMLPARAVLSELEPGLRGGVADQPEPLAWFPEEAWVDAAAMTGRLVEMARNEGGRLLSGPSRGVVRIGREGGRIASITLQGGQTLPVAAVVNAAGAEGAHIAALVGRRLAMASSPGCMVRAALPDGGDPLRRPIETDFVAVRPDGPGRVLLAIDVGDAPELAEAPLGPLPPGDPLVRRIMGWGAAVVPALAAAQATAAAVALRPIPADGLPSIGAVRAIPGYFEAVMHSGVTLAPLIGGALAGEILGEPSDPLLQPFRPERAALG